MFRTGGICGADSPLLAANHPSRLLGPGIRAQPKPFDANGVDAGISYSTYLVRIPGHVNIRSGVM